MKRSLEILNALANKTRLEIIIVLLQQDLCVCELQEILDLEQSRLSHQLRILRLSGLVETKQKGRWIMYSLTEEIRKIKFINALREEVKLGDSEQKRLDWIKKNRIWQRM
ncbi:MAG: ArsR/SmtB family transcription factor [Candidatus Aminicenantaceae bacterium]